MSGAGTSGGFAEEELPLVEGVGSDRVRSAAMHRLPWYVIVYEGPEHRVVALNAAELRVFGGFNPVGMRLVDFLGDSEEQGIVEIFDRAYADGTGPLELHAHLDEVGVITVSITDQGSWNPPPQPAPGRGLGLAIAQKFSDHLHVDPSPQGTCVTLTFTPWTTPHGSTARPPQSRSGMFGVYTDAREDVSIMTVRGPVDVDNVAELDVELALRTVPGAAALVIHLGQVSVLCSAAVHVIRRHVEQGRAAGVQVRLVAGPGSIADHVLALVGLTTHTAETL